MATDTGRLGGVLARDGLAFAAGYGALVTVGLSFVPFSSLLGGAVAAVRYDRGYGRGLAVGVLAGVGAAIPLGALFVPALWIARWLGFGIDPTAPAYPLFLAIVGALFLLYTVGLSALGGVAGVWADANTDLPLDPAARL